MSMSKHAKHLPILAVEWDTIDFPITYKRGHVEMYEPMIKEYLCDYPECLNKNDHINFVAISKINIPRRNEKLLKFVQDSALLTVKINAKMYMREYKNDDMRTGSGMITRVAKYDESIQLRNCPCFNCQISDNPKHAIGEIFIATSSKLIDNDYEARNATFTLFYDGEDSEIVMCDGYDMKILEGNKEAEVRCLTCDEALLDKLTKTLDQWEDQMRKNGTDKELRKFRFVIAHPHGCAKQMYVCNDKKDSGKLKHWKSHSKKCPGSSGAYVLSLSINTKSLWE